MPDYRVSLGGSYCNFGNLVRNSGQPGESLQWFEKAIRTLSAVYEKDRRLVTAKQFLRNSHENRAMAYDRLRKFTEAIKDWDKAIELSPTAGATSGSRGTGHSATPSRSGGRGRGGGRRADEERVLGRRTMVRLCLCLRHRQRQERRQEAGVCRAGHGPAAQMP